MSYAGYGRWNLIGRRGNQERWSTMGEEARSPRVTRLSWGVPFHGDDAHAAPEEEERHRGDDPPRSVVPAKIRGQLRRFHAAEAEPFVLARPLLVAPEVERAAFPSEQGTYEFGADALPLVPREHRPRGHLARAALVDLDLPDPDDACPFFGHQEPGPMQTA